MTTGQLNRRPTFYNTTPVQDSGAGSTDVESDRWQSWAEILDTSGQAFVLEAQGLNATQYKVTVRFDGRFRSTTWMIYEGQVCKCEAIDVQQEGYKAWLVMRFSKTDTWVNVS